MEEMIEKQITILVPLSALEEFEKVIDGCSDFTAYRYREEFNLQGTAFKSKTVRLEIIATKKIN